MQGSLRKVLIDSHVAAIVIALLLAGAVQCTFDALLDPASHILSFLTIALATHSPPYGPRTLDYASHNVSLQQPLFDLFSAVNNLACGWLLSLWVYGKSPLRILVSYRDKLVRKTDA